MLAYIIRRILTMIPTLVAISIISFIIIAVAARRFSDHVRSPTEC